MDLGLADRVALITGGGGDIGRALALGFAAEGAAVAVLDVDAEKAAATIELLRQKGGRGLPLPCDVGQWDQVQAAVERATKELGKVDILVNGAAVPLYWDKVEEIPEEGWQEVVRVNLTGVFYCCKAVARQMKERRWGKIVSISSIAGRRGGYPGTSSYGATKAGIIGLTATLARELGPYNINVNAVAPGLVNTARFRRGWDLHQEVREAFTQVPLGRLAEVQDLAGIVLLLSSEAASYITGQTVTVDGGMLGM